MGKRISLIAIACSLLLSVGCASDRSEVSDVATSPAPAADPRAAGVEALRCVLEARARADFDAARPCLDDRMEKYYKERWDGLPVVRYTLLQASSEPTVCPGAPTPTPPTPQPARTPDPSEFVGLGGGGPMGVGELVREDCVNTAEFVAVVRAYYGTIDHMVKFGEDTINVVRRKTGWVVEGWDEDGFNRGNLTGDPVKPTRIYLPSDDERGCTSEGVDDLVAVQRRIPDTEHVALNAVEEALSGPWKLGAEGEDEQATTEAFSPFARVWSVKVEDGTALVSVNAAAMSDEWPCNVAVRRAVIERTVREATAVRDVRISAEG